MDLSGGAGLRRSGSYPEGADAETLWRGDMFSKVLSDTEARGPGDAGPRTFSLERREPDKSQASGFPILDSGISFPPQH